MHDLFVSYSHEDREIVGEVVAELEKVGLSVWIDRRDLVPGVDWNRAITGALTAATAVVIFLSERSAKSDYISREILLALNGQIRVIPVLLPGTDYSVLPGILRHIQALDMDSTPPRSRVARAAREIARAVQQIKAEGSRGDIPDADLARFTGLAVSQTTEVDDRASPQKPLSEVRSAFVVHGHDDKMLQKMCEYLIQIQVNPVVPRDEESESLSLLQKFFDFGSQAKYAIVLLSGDDYGASLRQYESPNVGALSLQFRARQNVILELGFFYGKLGFENVFVLEKQPPKIFPNFERPSDLSGPVFNRFDSEGRWKDVLRRRLIDRGLV